ncbi:MAG: hypothetical protein ACR2O7_13870 [Parasphingorhabdus sp.]
MTFPGVRVALHTSCCSAAVSLLIHHAQPANIDLVMVDGRILKRDGKLTSLDEEQIVANSEQAITGLMQRGGLIAAA